MNVSFVWKKKCLEKLISDQIDFNDNNDAGDEKVSAEDRMIFMMAIGTIRKSATEAASLP